ncbi:protein phosphatase 2C domain-containing protein [Nocardioides sp. GY 10127]|uniref:PP2C family protein-serine/threonine phosphatase n=1 Tax=Nocardioides sp. GY 10127 TaxID=2569762 RepID=UPI0010A841DD|nr:protein phosphatase 2C domain-containing protein [Nocardioides sp. GY 10127]TIC81916.1 serine/threonine-protein phosphatase [Nocardioides sp. GY 10127]
MKQVLVRHGGATDVGRVRRVNEDSFLAQPPVFVVADGMGGHDGGDVASAIAVEELGRLGGTAWSAPEAAAALERALAAGQRRIAEYAQRQVAAGAERFHAGTTVVAAVLVQEGRPEETDDRPADAERPGWVLCHLGDSRIYRFADGRLEQVTRDHSLVQDYLDAGMITPEEAAVHPERHVITRALDGRGTPQPDLLHLPLRAGERLLLCSDGVTGMLPVEEIATILARSASATLAAQALVDAAVAAGGRDNATAVVVDVAEQVEASAGDTLTLPLEEQPS